MDNLKKLGFEMAIDQVRELMPLACQLMFDYYKQLIATGFTEEQAIRLVIAHGMTIGNVR